MRALGKVKADGKPNRDGVESCRDRGTQGFEVAGIVHFAYIQNEAWRKLMRDLKLTTDPLITIDATGTTLGFNPLTISGSSPLIGAGDDTADEITINSKTFNLAEDDFYLNPRPASGRDIGAVEF